MDDGITFQSAFVTFSLQHKDNDKTLNIKTFWEELPSLARFCYLIWPSFVTPFGAFSLPHLAEFCSLIWRNQVLLRSLMGLRISWYKSFGGAKLQHTPGDERLMMGEAPHVEFQFRVDVGTIHDIVLLFRQRFPKLPPCLARQHQLLCTFQHAPTHGAAILGVDTLFPEESHDILIHPLLISLGLLAQVVHHRATMLPIIT